MSKCETCSHQYACAAWIRHCETIYDDFVYSTDNCPYYINTMENFVSKTVYSIVNLYDYDGNTDTEVLGVFETLDEAKEQLRVQYEWNRMCSEHGCCDDCPFWGIVCTEEAAVVEVPEDVIAIVQKWSDEHPVVNPMMTWKGKLRELLPNANLVALSNLVAMTSGIQICPSDVFGEGAPNCLNGCSRNCTECWNSEHKEEDNG